MRYTQKIKYTELKDKYDYIIGWGNSPAELSKRFFPGDMDFEYIINGQNMNIGKKYCGKEIVPADFMLNKTGKICFILFTNLEPLLLRQIEELYPEADTIMSRLVDVGNNAYRYRSYSTDREDLILLELVRKLQFPYDFPYLDIGVCHPVVRNNTFLLYENGYYNGTLVEPNPEMAILAGEYRPKNILINAGAGLSQGSLPYVRKKDGGKAGLNHFLAEGEVIDSDLFYQEDLPILEINELLAGMKDSPWLMDIDTEGMDYSLLERIDMAKTDIKIICAERDRAKNIKDLLTERGFLHYTETLENIIMVRQDVFDKL